jgi:hypothetical protein
MDVWNLNEPGSTDATITGMSSDVWYEVTLHHFGQGSHWWVCSNGQSSTEANPTFYFGTGGTYTFTHVYIDPCGHMDTQTWTYEVYETGIGEQVEGRPWVSATEPGMLSITGGGPGDLLEVFDAQGRAVASQVLSTGSTIVFCPSGLVFWRIADGRGTIWSGKAMVP